MSDIFREVEEDVRREQLKKLWDRYGVIVIGIAVLIVVATAGWRGWEWYTARQAASAGEAYYQALLLAQRGDPGAIPAFEAIVDEGGAFAPLARLRLAAERAAAGDREAAVAAYDAMAADSRLDPQLRNLARIRAGYLLVDVGDVEAATERVGALAVPDGPWRHSAREILGLSAYLTGDLAAAAGHFEDIIADPETPEELRNRAQLMAALTAADRAPEAGQALSQ